ncbi:hypothetical protein VTO73DRAFT_5586 [Trametes versicolor]
MSKFGTGDELVSLVQWITIVSPAVVWSFTTCELLVLMVNAKPSAFMARFIPIFPPSTAPDLYISPLFIVGWFLLVLGGGFRLWCYRTLGRLFTYQLSFEDDHHLITTGPYSVVRHPSYMGWTIFAVGLLTMQLSPGSWFMECGPSDSNIGCFVMAAWVVYNVYLFSFVPGRMIREDRALKRQFGDEWLQWSKKTPYKLIPGLY